MSVTTRYITSRSGLFISGQANTFADLPDASQKTSQVYLVLQSSGVWLVNRKSAGLYSSDGISWSIIEDYNTLTAQIAANSSAISAKQDLLVSGSNIKTINGNALLGSGDLSLGGGLGTVTNFIFTNANGMAGSVSLSTLTPTLTLSTTVSGIVKGNGTSFSSATVGSDYSGGTSALGTGILKSTTGTGALTIAAAGDFPTLNQSTTGSAATWTTGRTISLTGDVTGTSGAFNGSANLSFSATIANTSVTFAKIQNISTASFLGRVTAGAGSPENLTGSQATTLLDTFTSALKGLAPASGGGTTNFLRADGTWAAPAGGGGGGSPAGSSNDIQINTSGSFAADTGTFTYDPTTKTFGLTGVDAKQLISGVTTEPGTPSAGLIYSYARAISGRMLPKIKGPSGLDTPLQPALFQNSIWLVQPNTTTSVSAVGGAVTSVGTISHPAPSATSNGYCSNFASGAVAGNTAGTGHVATPYSRGSTIASGGGFFIVMRLWFPDADYGSGATGSRLFVGLTSNTMATEIASDNAAGSRIGFVRSTNLSETNWMLTTKNGTTETRVSTGMAFASSKLYDFYIFCPPGSSTVSWRIDNLTDSTTQEGTATSTLPATTTYMRAGFQIATLTTTARNVRMKKIYVETDN